MAVSDGAPRGQDRRGTGIDHRFVVTVDRDGPRMQEFRDQPGGHRFEVFDGVDLRRETPVEVAGRVDGAVLRSRYARDLAPGEVGCALSHREVMKHIASLSALSDLDAVLVVEDDAVLHEDLEMLLPWLLEQPFDVMPLHHGSASRLGIAEPEGSLLMERLYPMSPWARSNATGGFRVGYTSPEAWMLTVGYLVRKRAARHLARLEEGLLTRVADDYRVIGNHGLRVCQVRPSLIWESANQESVITGTGRVLGSSDTTDTDVIRRMRSQATSRGLHLRKQAWLTGRDLSSRLPWSVRQSALSRRARASWNDAVPRMPARLRHLARPGVP
ncbi:Glycosyltransferase involved in LPS biosynthesis, GR25 family [Nocardioides alpinus]|uniref:Glycosyltransferase involved in LPS biosynthesis, GR25 family n=1 Tax=Nocardioides alpinus TaxID=748909 RepID=A0A1I0W378_9ACTN|nr:glycosyltransferase family 25 protein [Nocardioides alpinus]PKH37655.1 hypothetical protein CXG46_19715 [Nocardioides alpinus]SFA83082.1 Glycosyltransferase involved in LPS biosynthesis, GR25 family [Nocardioides alpinus]